MDVNPYIYQISLLFSVNALVLLITAVLVSGNHEKLYFTINRKKLLTASSIIGSVFLMFVIMTVVTDVLSMY